MERFVCEGLTVTLSPSGTPGAPLLCLVTMADAEAAVREALAALDVPDHSLACVSGFDWSRDLSPWPAPALGKGGGDFAGEAGALYRTFETALLPALTARLDAPPCWQGIAGYSLAGLFALLAFYETDCFTRAASASGSLWYPDLEAYVAAHAFRQVPEALYLSIGDKERRTRHPLMRQGQQVTERLAAQYAAAGVKTAFVLEPGNHFQDAAGRMARGLAWLLRA